MIAIQMYSPDGPWKDIAEQACKIYTGHAITCNRSLFPGVFFPSHCIDSQCGNYTGSSSPCKAASAFHSEDYYIQKAIESDKVWSNAQQGYTKPSFLVFLGLRQNNDLLSAHDPLGVKDYRPISLLPYLSKQTSLNLPCICHRNNFLPSTITKTPAVECILFDHPLLNLVYAKSLTASRENSIIFSWEKQPAAQQFLYDILLFWKTNPARSKSRSEDARALDNSISLVRNDFLLPSFCTKANLLLHLNFLSARGAGNANLHSAKYHFRNPSHIAQGLHKSNISLCETDKSKISATTIFQLLGEFSAEEQWYYEMSTGLSLTAELTALVLELEEIHPLRASENKIRFTNICILLTTFQKKIISCPAPFWRIAVLRHLIFQFDRKNQFISTDNSFVQDFEYQLLKHSTQIGAVRKLSLFTNSPDAYRICYETQLSNTIFPFLNHSLAMPHIKAKFDVAANQFPEIFCPHPSYTLGILDEDLIIGTFSDKSILDPVIDEVLFENQQAYASLSRIEPRLNFPFSFCSANHPHISNFSALEHSQIPLSKKVDTYFSKIHSILYPNGYDYITIV